jgi:hypothetical protein
MIYPYITLSKLRTALQYASEHEGLLPEDIDDSVGFRGDGDNRVSDVLSLLKGELESLIPASGIDSRFDSKARELIHGYLSNLDTQILIDSDFWRYLSGVYFYDIVRTRHPENKKAKTIDANWANFGGKSSVTTESLIFRLFLGADLSIDRENRSDPYHLAKVHDVDLWQSHIIRVLSGENPIYARALLLWFKDRDKWYSKQSNSTELLKEMERYDNFKTAHLRDFVKRVRRVRSNVIHELLSLDEVRAMISSLALESLEKRADWAKKKSLNKTARAKRASSPSKARPSRKKSAAKVKKK